RALRELHLDRVVHAPAATARAMINYDIVFGAFAFVFGAAVGSFLNVVIYRLPLDLSVNEPERSFCPSCKQQIPWRHNLPLLSWIALRGRCANCGAPISFRYFAVELMTSPLFLTIWRNYPWQMAVAYRAFFARVTAPTFIDFDHFFTRDDTT